MFIEASVGAIAQPDLCRTAAGQAVAFLEQIAGHVAMLKRPASAIESPPRNTLALTMYQAVVAVGDRDLTAMAAVAGTIADATADFLEDRGMTRVVVNNGGDVALRLKGRETVTVGIRPQVQEEKTSHRVRITPEMGVGGVATSGLGGRSFTRGVASAATVLSSRAAVADAAATAVANASCITSPRVHRRRADSIDPDTDLKGLDVTESVGDLTEEEIQTALFRGLKRADELVERGVIMGACITVMGSTKATRYLAEQLEYVPSPKGNRVA